MLKSKLLVPNNKQYFRP